MEFDDAFLADAKKKRESAKQRVFVWIAHFEDQRTAQLAEWLGIALAAKLIDHARRVAEEAQFWSRDDHECGPNSREEKC